ncbi:CHAT domain-containing protein [Fulvivirgaceae bacterium BMA12]|uniref:CHAT domain-containing protein n=1 Tax=Agaribacillus aureus TaxID=3051825 RepID=A0ABT8LGZ9_9BACT|nr:CHAT domain-containing protein [Fulvivirgaceae bacterium BMA12]
MGSNLVACGVGLYNMLCLLVTLSVFFACQNQSQRTVGPDKPMAGEDSVIVHNFDDYGHPYLRKALSVQKMQGRTAAEEFYLAALSLFENEENWIGYTKTAIVLARNYNYSKDREKAKPLLQKALRKCIAHLGEQNSIAADLEEKLGDYFYYSQEADSVLKHYSRCLSIRSKIYDENHLKLADINHGLGNLYRWRLNDYYNAEKYYTRELLIREKANDTVARNFSFCYYNLAVTNRRKKDYEKALLYANKTLGFINKYDSSNYEVRKSCFNVLANISNVKGEFENAITYYNRAIELIRDKDDLASLNSLALYYNNLGTVYRQLNNPSEAIKYYRQALLTYQVNTNQAGLADTYNKLGIAYVDLGKLDSAFYFIHKYVNKTKSYYGKKHFRTAKSMTVLANQLLKQTPLLDSALITAHRALVAGLDGFDERDPMTIPSLAQMGSNFYLIDALKSKGLILKEMAAENDWDPNLLEGAINSFLLADSLITIERGNFGIENSKLYLAKDYKSIYEHSLECAYRLFSITQDEIFGQHAFNFMEKSKSRLLLENLENVESLNQAGVSEAVKTLERDLKTEIANLNRSLRNESEASKPDSQRINLLNQKLFKANTRKDSLANFLAANFPRYFNIKYKHKNYAIDDVKSLVKDKLLLEYFWGDSAIYLLAINRDLIQFEKVAIDSTFTGRFNNYLKMLTNPKFDLTDSTINSAQWLYKKLLPVLDTPSKIQGELVIIPDGPLAYLPFETLVTNTGNAKKLTFKSVNFLIYDWAISYVYSTELLFDKTLKNKEKAPKLLAFSYSDIKTKTGKVNTEGHLSNLQGSAKEIEAIKSLMQGRFLKGEDATEQQFKNLASGFDILHLAVHGAASKGDSIDAKLYFRDKSNQVEDGILYPYELYNLNLDANMVVLSACETGLGNYKKGEGVFSMARAFAYAGCPSIVMSLWKVSDQITARMMTDFYGNLNKGIKINSSLRESKLKYLDKADELTAHPFYWAAFVPIGQSKAITTTSNHYFYWILGIMMVFIVGLTLKKYRKD